MQFITIAGNVGKDAETKSVNGNSVTEWSVAVSNGRDKPSTWFKCSMWGNRGEKVAGYIRKGDKITVAGTLQAGVYDGKPDLKISVAEITLQGGRQEAGTNAATGSAWQNNGMRLPHGNGAGTADDLDDDLPFATNDPMAREPGASKRRV